MEMVKYTLIALYITQAIIGVTALAVLATEPGEVYIKSKSHFLKLALWWLFPFAWVYLTARSIAQWWAKLPDEKKEENETTPH